MAALRQRVAETIVEIQKYNAKIEQAEISIGDAISEASTKALTKQQVDSDILHEMDSHDWAQLAITIGEKKALQKWMDWCKQEEMKAHPERYTVAAASPKFNAISWTIAVVVNVPVLVMGMEKDFDADAGADFPDAKLTVLLPGLLFAILTSIILGAVRLMLGKDLVRRMQ
jgi:hypothetical protein